MEKFTVQERKDLSLMIALELSRREMGVTELLKVINEGDEVKLTYTYLQYFVDKVLQSILGTIKRKSKYFVDDYEVAKELIEEYYEKKSNTGNTSSNKDNKSTVRFSTWIYIRDMMRIISENPGITTSELCEKYKRETGRFMSTQVIDRYNESLVLNSIGIDFYKSTSRGVKMRLSNPDTLKVIDSIILKLNPKKARALDEKTNEHVVSTELQRLSDSERREIQIRVCNILYLDSKANVGLNVKDICDKYRRRYNNYVSETTVSGIIQYLDTNSLNGFVKVGDSYYIEDYSKVMDILAPDKSILHLLVSIPINSVELLNGLCINNGSKEFSRSVGDRNEYEIVTPNTREFCTSLAKLRLRGLEVIYPIHMRNKLNELLESYIDNMNEVL